MATRYKELYSSVYSKIKDYDFIRAYLKTKSCTKGTLMI